MDWKDLGQEATVGEALPSVPVKKWYPHLDIDLKKAPELSMDVGDECVFLVKGKVVSKRMDESSKSQCLEIHSVALPEKEKSKNEADEVLESLQKGKRY